MTEYTDEQKNAMFEEIEKYYPAIELMQEGDISVRDIMDKYNCGKDKALKIMGDMDEKGIFKLIKVKSRSSHQNMAVIRKVTK